MCQILGNTAVKKIKIVSPHGTFILVGMSENT